MVCERSVLKKIIFRKKIGLLLTVSSALAFCTGSAVVKEDKPTKVEYLPNTYFSEHSNISAVYLKMLAESILHKHGISAEVTIS